MLKTLEAVLAAIAIITVFILVYKGITMPDIETINWRYYGFNALKSLDSSGLLAKHAINNDTKSLNNSLRPYMPAGIEYDTIICATVCAQPNTESTKITSVSYYIAGNVTNFEPKKIVLYMWS